jgi:hypothetical protein
MRAGILLGAGVVVGGLLALAATLALDPARRAALMEAVAQKAVKN